MSSQEIVGSHWRTRILLPRDADFHRQMILAASGFNHSGRTPKSDEVEHTLEAYTGDFHAKVGDHGIVAIDEAMPEPNPLGVISCRQLANVEDKKAKVWRLPAPMPEIALAVIPEARGRGVGRVLLRRMLSDLRQSGIPGACLSVLLSNEPAGKLYQSEGFRPYAMMSMVGRPEENSLIMVADLRSQAVAA